MSPSAGVRDASAGLPASVQRTVVTVGSFDGVHRGHWQVLEEIARRAASSAGRSVLVTFEPHPLEIVNPEAAPPLLTLAHEKRAILAQSGLDYVAFFPFTRELAQYAPEQFVREVLERRFRMRELVIGHDHGFGRARTGDVALLTRLGAEDGFAVDVVPPVELDGRPISSTLIRRAVAGGDLETAARALGRPYAMTSVVVRGTGRGHRIGVPTINLAAPGGRKLLPPDGVYAARAAWRGGAGGAGGAGGGGAGGGGGTGRGGMLHLGPRPTFGEPMRSLEMHLFDFDGDLYGESVTVEFLLRLREVRGFESVEELRRQLAQDRAAALDALTASTGPVTV